MRLDRSYPVRSDVIKTLKAALSQSNRIGFYDMDESLEMLVAYAKRHAPTAVDATTEEWMNGMRAFRMLTADGRVRWWERYDYSRY